MTGGPVKLCIIGNSFVGAVYRAYQAKPEEFRRNVLIDFHAAGGINFKHIGVDGGRIVNARPLSVQYGERITDYDAVIVYGLLPNPHEIAQLRRDMDKQGYSSQVAKLTVADVILASESSQLAQTLKPFCRENIFAVSKNVASNSAGISAVEFEAAAKDIAIALDDIHYVPFPRRLFNDSLAPVMDWYRDSVKIDGAAGDPTTQSKQDIYHMNPSGGALVLNAIVETVDQRRALLP